MIKIAFERIVIVTIVILVLITVLLTNTCSTATNKVSTKTIPFCTLLPSSVKFATSIDTASFVGSQSLYWNKGTVLRIYFCDGSPDAIQRVMHVANLWASLSGLTFKQVFSKYQSEIRISFYCPGYNSLVGKQANDPSYVGLPTMCLQGLDETTDQELFKRTVLHEFGHVMGLLHELQNPKATIPWDTVKLYEYYDSLYHWGPDSVNKWVLTLYEAKDVDASDYDTSSIMMYAVPREVTKGGYSIPWPNKLSTIDSLFVKQKYR